MSKLFHVVLVFYVSVAVAGGLYLAPDGVNHLDTPAATLSLALPPWLRPAGTIRGIDHIQHFVFIMQENRSFDSYFGTYPGADRLPAGVCLPSVVDEPCVASYHDASDINHGGPHDYADAMAATNGGRMDGFVRVAMSANGKALSDECHSTLLKCQQGLDPRDVMGWHDQREIPNYWNYAHLFVLQDHLYSSVPTFTLPNRLFALAGQSGGYLSHGQTQPTGFNFPEITQVLSERGIDWKAYVTVGRQPDPIDGHVLSTGSKLENPPSMPTYFNPLPDFPSVRNSPEQMSRLVDTAQFYADAQSGNLPQVSWVIPSEPVSEHPPSSIRKGMAYVTGVVNAVMAGPDWSTSAIFIGYDEAGGFYDHVLPPRVDGEMLGIRVPGLVISPYAKQGYVDHHVYTPVSWLHLVEERFGLPSLTTRDATASDMQDAFDFSQSPRPPVFLAATTAGTPYPMAVQLSNSAGN